MPTCPVCNNTKNEKLEKHNQYTGWNCPRCTLGFSHPMKQADSEWYEQNQQYADYHANPYKYGLTWGHKMFLKHGTRFLQKKDPLLDYACGNGLFLETLQDLGYSHLYGFDFDENAIQSCRRFGLSNCYQEFKKISPRKYSAITALEILEHVDDPQKLIQTFCSLLKPKGVLVLSVPNRNRYPDTIPTGADLPPHHLTRWTPLALQKLLESNGFQLLELEEKNFDLPELLGLLRERLGLTHPQNTFFAPQKQAHISSKAELQRKEKIVHLGNILLSPGFLLLKNIFKFKGHSISALAQKL